MAGLTLVFAPQPAELRLLSQVLGSRLTASLTYTQAPRRIRTPTVSHCLSITMDMHIHTAGLPAPSTSARWGNYVASKWLRAHLIVWCVRLRTVEPRSST